MSRWFTNEIWPTNNFQVTLCMMWCRCFVKYDFYYCMECRKCCVVNPSRGPAGGTDCDLDSATLVSLKPSCCLSPQPCQQISRASGLTDNTPAMAFMCAGLGLTAGSRFMWKTGHIKSRWSAWVRGLYGQLSGELESYSEFLRRWTLVVVCQNKTVLNAFMLI